MKHVICPHCERTIASVEKLPAHIRSLHPKEWRDIWQLPSIEQWNIIAPSGSEDLVRAAIEEVIITEFDGTGTEISERIAARVPGARVGPLATN